ncbi:MULTISPECIES: hypothetical protein [unclassified Okeania]|uniref:hypothetical protein n=1 Tax=unclassified Okeania TaxID=2634635 RepID=UPI000F53FC03|nr:MULTISPECIES: hypothetical protein [unclassified Okeania]NES74882.1 hypothetical protein [Okeania sp. SIO1H4]NET12051.1 hypothetical protein [Okeania sp. SIO1H6]NET20794.1 hypothetical protein [Okeania sp. SIO1H5]NET91961.1 hypothetical protein [Okeania sp. SIO1H2]
MLFKQPTFLQYFPFHKITPLATISIFEVYFTSEERSRIISCLVASLVYNQVEEKKSDTALHHAPRTPLCQNAL